MPPAKRLLLRHWLNVFPNGTISKLNGLFSCSARVSKALKKMVQAFAFHADVIIFRVMDEWFKLKCFMGDVVVFRGDTPLPTRVLIVFHIVPLMLSIKQGSCEGQF